MLFKKYTVYENKLSEQLNDDNPLKQKLVEMETPTDKHPLYSFLIWGLLAYGWIFFIALFHMQAHGFILATMNLVFATFCILICYKKNYVIGIVPKYRRNMYIIGAISIVFSVLIASLDNGTASWKEIGDSFLFFENINQKSYIALAIILYTALSISLSYYSCPYELYRSFYSAHKTYPSEKNEDILINKSLGLAIFGLLLIWKIIYDAFNPAEDDFENMLKNFSIFVIAFWIPVVVSSYQAKRYIRLFKKAVKKQKRIS